jgi:DNA-binding NtrC family response regulator
MKSTAVFIIEKEQNVANLIRYNLIARQAKQVQVFACVTECMYFMEKKSTPDFLIVDVAHPEINPPAFLKYILHSFPKVKVLFISSQCDQMTVSQLIEEGATDYICKSARMEDWIHELIKNMEFLIRKKFN